MPFIATNLVPLTQANGFTLWHYRSDDLRSVITAAGYFGAVATRFRPGDVMILQASDTLAIISFRSNATTGAGVVLDGAVVPIALTRTAAMPFRMTQAVAAIVRTIVLAPIVAGIIVGGSIPVQAQVNGPISEVIVSLRNASGQILPPTQRIAVSQGFANVAIPAPAIGTGYRIRVEDAADPEIAATSASFSVLPDFRFVLQQDGARLLQEDGSKLVQD
jgi:hypothetical protein